MDGCGRSIQIPEIKISFGNSVDDKWGICENLFFTVYQFFFEIFRFCQSIRDTLLEFKPRITEFWAISGWQKSSSIHNHTLRDVTSIIFPQKKTNDLSLTDVLDKKYIPFSFWIIAGWTGITFLWLSYIFHISPSTF